MRRTVLSKCSLISAIGRSLARYTLRVGSVLRKVSASLVKDDSFQAHRVDRFERGIPGVEMKRVYNFPTLAIALSTISLQR